MMQTDILGIAFSLALLVVSIIIHEVAHGYAANALGDPTAKLAGRLTLNPLKHIDLYGSVIVPAVLVLTHTEVLFGWAKPVPYNPYNLKNQRWGEAIVAGAGATTNILIAVIFGLVVRFGYGALPAPFLLAAGTLSFINLFLGLFNLIPIPPMDGYTVLRGILPYRAAMGLRQFEDRVRAGGIGSILLVLIVFSLFFAGPFYTFVLWAFGLLVGSF
jgi:Zn-dependent protease